MLFFKKCYVNTTEGVDVISVIHELKYAIRDSKAPGGLLTAIVPQSGAGLVIMTPMEEAVNELKATMDVFGAEAGVAKDRLKRDKEVGPMVQAALLGRTVHIPFQDGNLLIDPYDEVLLVDFVHKSRRREFIIQIIYDAPAQEATPPKGKPLGGIKRG